MNSEQIRVIIENIDEIQRGISNRRTKELGIRQFCVRRVRKIEDKRTSLYLLSNEWKTYIDNEIQKLSNKATQEIYKKLEHSSPLKNHVENISSSIDSSTLDEQPKLDQTEANISELFEELPNSSSSFIDETSCRDLSRSVYRIFIKNENDSINLFNRVILLRHYFYILSDSGLSSTEIIENDLYEILVKFLFHTADGLYKLKDESCFHYEYYIYRYYIKGIQDYINSIPEECYESIDIIDFIRKHGVQSNEISKQVQIIIDSIIFNKRTTDIKMIFKCIPLISDETIKHLMITI